MHALSILCLTYNHAKYIEEALEGFFKQNYKGAIQLVIHDDCSTDDTVKIIREYCRIYMPANFELNLITQQENRFSRGQPILPLVIKACTGKYIAFCEGDDVWVDENKLSEQINFLENNEEYSVVYSNFQPFDENGYRSIRIKEYKDYSNWEMALIPQIFPLTACFRNVIEIPPESNTSPYGDIFIWAKLSEHGKGKFIFSDTPPRYRMHGQGLSSMVDEHSRNRSQIISYAQLMRYYQRTKMYNKEEAMQKLIQKIVLKRYIKDLIPAKLFEMFKIVRNAYNR